MLTAVIIAINWIGTFKTFLLVMIVIVSFLLMLVVLLQEPKGGGLSAAFGGAGAESFGVQAGGVNKFTAWVAGIFMLIAVLYAAIREEEADAPTDRTREITAPSDPGTTPPAKDEGGGG
ncbi:MAG: preprotein translocase subunit SecG [Planctomycetota bacterium]|nr:preprotein translocase subunit SecG [Planctomycetota bacterium]